jgi:hypothetical protein
MTSNARPMNDITNATAGAAVVSPFWLPSLQQVSEIASVMLPILGAAWLVVQIVAKIIEVRRRR